MRGDMKLNNSFYKIHRGLFFAALGLSLLYFPVSFTGCGDSSDKWYLFHLPEATEENKDGSSQPMIPAGADTLSSSTNHSSGSSGSGNSPSRLADPLSGLTIIQPPSVSSYGGMGFAYPISVPAGRAGMQPSIGLSYSTSGGDGAVGSGWSFSVPAITRSAQYGVPKYDNTDTFTDGGSELVHVGGGVYRTRLGSGSSRYEFDGNSWQVRDTSGTLYIYGNDNATRYYDPDNTSKVFCWLLWRIIDRNGNYVEYVYDTSRRDETNNIFIKEIKYTGNINTGSVPKLSVRFEYDRRDDKLISGISGFKVTSDVNLREIVTYIDDGRLRRYYFSYERS